MCSQWWRERSQHKPGLMAQQIDSYRRAPCSRYVGRWLMGIISTAGIWDIWSCQIRLSWMKCGDWPSFPPPPLEGPDSSSQYHTGQSNGFGDTIGRKETGFVAILWRVYRGGISVNLCENYWWDFIKPPAGTLLPRIASHPTITRKERQGGRSR
jgi:hypothetical protein